MNLNPWWLWQLRQAAAAVRSGGVIAYPTEALFGLGCDPFNATAVIRLLQLKQRSMEQGLIVIADSWQQLEQLVAPIDVDLRGEIERSWPGPVTWLLPKRPNVPEWLCGQHSDLAVRVPGHSAARALCRQLGHPLVSTSANPSGRSPARTPFAVRRYFGTELDYILHGSVGLRDSASEIRRIDGSRVR